MAGYNYIMRGIDFPSAQNSTGFMVGESLTYMGNGIVLKTTDAGTSWTQLWTGTNEGLEGASFPDLNTGYVAGWPKISAGWSGFAKTTDGGSTWTSVPVDPNVYYFTDVVFKDVSNGILLGSTNSAPRVWVTANGGTSWTIATGISGVPAHACYISGDTYFLVDNGGNIKKSVNNGSSWTTVFTGGGTLTGIDFFNASVGMACGADGQIIKTSDGGATWTGQMIGSNPWHDFAWEDVNHVFLCGTPEVVVESSDGGANWINSFPQSALQAALYECIFTPNGTGFICGSGGVVLKRAPSCHAYFTGSSTGICTGNSVSFSSQSTGSNLTSHWYFEGGTPPSSTATNPTVTYSAAGTFDVKLVVSNGSWSDSLLKPNYVTVVDPPAAPVITANGTFLTSSAAAGNQWYYNGNLITGETAQTMTATQTGMYWDIVTQNSCPSDTSNNLYILMTGIPEPGTGSLSVSPAEGTGGKIFRIRFFTGSETSCTLTVYDITGHRIYRNEIRTTSGINEKDLDLTGSPSGMYLVELSGPEGRNVRSVLAK